MKNEPNDLEGGKFWETREKKQHPGRAAGYKVSPNQPGGPEFKSSPSTFHPSLFKQ